MTRVKHARVNGKGNRVLPGKEARGGKEPPADAATSTTTAAAMLVPRCPTPRSPPLPSPLYPLCPHAHTRQHRPPAAPRLVQPR